MAMIMIDFCCFKLEEQWFILFNDRS